MFFIVRFSYMGKMSLLASLLVSSFMVQAQTAESDAAVEQKTSEQQSPVYHFPQWPQRKQAKKEILPPPPPGPYMSTALSGKSIKAPSFSKQATKRSMAFDSSDITMDTFSPDIPWPKNLTAPSPSRWMPDNGYQYVQPRAMDNRRQAVPTQVNPNNYHPRSVPSMNWSGMRFNPNSTSNYPGSGMPTPDMGWSNNRTRGGSAPMNRMPSMGNSANQNQMRRPYQGNANTYMPNRGPSRQAPRQGGLQ